MRFEEGVIRPGQTEGVCGGASVSRQRQWANARGNPGRIFLGRVMGLGYGLELVTQGIVVAAFESALLALTFPCFDQVF
jgi:hypothetical protein